MPVMRDDARPLGVVYTPADVARPMVQLALGPMVAGKSADELRALRVCDPAIGEGAFLVEVIEVVAAELARAAGIGIAEARRKVAATCIAGVDVDRKAVEAARRATGAGVGALRVGDALALDWAAEFAEVFARGQAAGGFDVVIANPPYVRQEQLRDKGVLRGYEAYDGVADLYVYFVELAVRLLRPGGRWCVIVPNKWMTVAYGEKLRAMLAARTSVDGVADVSRAALFDGADAFPCIVWGTNEGGRTTAVRAVRASTTATVAEALAAPGERIERARWSAGPWHLDGGDEGKLLARLERAFPRLDATVAGRPARGVVTGCNRAFVIDAAARARILDADPAAEAMVRPFVKGRDVRRWEYEDAGRFVLLVDRGAEISPAVRAHLAPFRAELEPRTAGAPRTAVGRKPGSYAWYELQDPVGPLVKSRAPRLLYQDIQTQPACALDAGGEVVPDTTVWMLPTDDPWVLAVLNSSLYGWYARRRFPPALNGAVRPKLAYLSALPLPELAAADRRVVARLVARRDERALADAIADAYGLSRAERALVARDGD